MKIWFFLLFWLFRIFQLIFIVTHYKLRLLKLEHTDTHGAMRNVKNQLTNSKEKKILSLLTCSELNRGTTYSEQIRSNKKVSYDFQQWLIRNYIVFVTSTQVSYTNLVVLCTQAKKTVTFFIAANRPGSQAWNIYRTTRPDYKFGQSKRSRDSCQTKQMTLGDRVRELPNGSAIIGR